MAHRIEEYALIGDCRTAALVGKGGSIDWLAVPRFDAGACFAALLGTERHGRWLIAPTDGRQSARRYRANTLILETDFEAPEGSVTVVDFMPMREKSTDVVRIVEGREGAVPMRSELIIRFDYGSIVPWVRRTDRGIFAIAGPDSLYLQADLPVHGEGLSTVSNFVIHSGERRAFVLRWVHSADREPRHPLDTDEALAETEKYWRDWSSRATYRGQWRDDVVRSLITLKALTYAPTGGIVAAPTTSLPERIGGSRNWDYRYCWLRDATFALYALLVGGYHEEARRWREWLVRAVAGDPSELRIMYGLGGERRLPELVLDWLPGYENSRPVRIGNAASNQHQLDVYGEVMDALHLARCSGLHCNENTWRVQRALMGFLQKDWTNPDEGIWEVRGARRQFTHSKIMAWVGADRAIRDAERFGLEGPLEDWRRLRDAIRRDVCTHGHDASRNAFVQSYGSPHLDASLLMIPLVGFLPASDPRVRGTVEAIGRELTQDGLIRRYRADSGVDGMEQEEGAFLCCTFWFADNLALQGRHAEARAVFERLLALRNDVGLLAEEYDPVARRFLGNFPQAFSHVGLINTARNLTREGGPAEHRAKGEHELDPVAET